MPKFCTGCGLQLPSDNIKFCPECDENLSKNQEQFKLIKDKKKRLGKLGFVGGVFSIFAGAQ
jgi:hypothetical protein